MPAKRTILQSKSKRGFRPVTQTGENVAGGAVRAGLAHARQNGKQLARPQTAGLEAAKIAALYSAGVPKAEIARRLQIERTSVRRILTSKKP